jgi:eukaryotic-like serine/threonine-protein kinase
MPAPPNQRKGGKRPPDKRAKDPLVGTTIGGKYRILAILGHGGMATVYEAEQRPSGRAVAVKVLNASHPDKRELLVRFQREARLIEMVKHPNICEVYDADILPNGRP